MNSRFEKKENALMFLKRQHEKTALLREFVSILRTEKEFRDILIYDGHVLDIDRAKIIHLDKRTIVQIPAKDNSFNIYAKIRLINRQMVNDVDLIDKSKDEFHRLQFIWENIKDSPIKNSISQPLFCSKQKPILFFSECPGENMEQYVNRKTLLQVEAELPLRLHLAGEWLGCFHSLFNKKTTYNEKNINTLKKEFSQSVHILSKYLSRSLLNEATKCFNDCIEVNKKNIVQGFIHKNYSLRNIMSNGKVMNIIDFEGAGDGLIYYDIGTILSEIEMKARFSFHGKHLIDALKSEFLEGYCKQYSIDIKLIPPFICYFMFRYIARSLTSYSGLTIEKINTLHKLRFVKKWISNRFI